MPNPFLRGGPMRMSREAPDRERPTGVVEPVLESVPGTVFAYRGQQTHGVATSVDAAGVDDDDWARAAEYDAALEEPEDEVQPIPVRIVDNGPTEIRRSVFSLMSATGTDKGGAASQLIGNDFAARSRTLVRIRNNSSTVIYIAHEARAATAQFGWPLIANEVFECTSHEALFATGSVAAESQVSVYAEFSVAVTHA